MSFSQLRIRSDILKGLNDIEKEGPTPFQKQIFNAMKEGGDLIIHSSKQNKPETGYLASILNQIALQERRQGTRAIILTKLPSRIEELRDWIHTAGSYAQIEAAVMDESGDPVTQRHALSAGPAIIVAHPDRLATLMEENRMVFRETGWLILDRVDELENLESTEVIRKRVLGQSKVLATVTAGKDASLDQLRSLLQDPGELKASVKKTLSKPINGKADQRKSGDEGPAKDKKPGKQKPRAGNDDERAKPGQPDKQEKSASSSREIPKDLTQYYIKVPPRKKISTLMSQLGQNDSVPTLIFTASRRTADRLYRILRKNGLRAVSLHHGVPKKTFKERLERYKSNNVQHLIAGELNATELGLEKTDQVINYDVPEEVEEYRYRAELTGWDDKARIVSLVSKQDRSDIHEIIEQLGYAPEEIPLPEEVLKESGKQNRGKRNRQEKQKPGAGKPDTQAKSRQSAKQKSSKKKRPRPGSRVEGPSKGAEGLPRPSYDKLSGGRSGDKEREKGLKGFFKKLFS